MSVTSRFLPMLALLLTAASPTGGATTEAKQAIDSARDLVMSKPADALVLARMAEHRLSDAPGSAQRATAVALAQTLQADALSRLDRNAEAWPLIQSALPVLHRVAAGGKWEGDALAIRGQIHAVNGELAAALGDFHHAYHDYVRAAANRDQATTLLLIGSLYGDATDYVTALKYINQAIAINRGEPRLELAILNNQASALQEIGRFAEAEIGYRRALGIAQQMESPLLEARLLGNIARARLKLGDVPGAQDAIDQALVIARQGEAASWRLPLEAIAAQAAYQRGDYARAARLIAHRFAGVDLATTTIQFREAHETAYKTYRATGDISLALRHLAALKRLDDQATKLATSANAALASAQFDFANQELRLTTLQRDDANRKVELERQRVQTQQLAFSLIGGAVAIVLALLAAGVLTLRRSRDRVRAVAADLAVTNDRLGKALAAKTEFLATTSHEIRTPLNGILGMTQVMLADRRLPNETRERIGVVHGAGVTMRALVDDILDVAKMETGNLTVEDAAFDLHATLNEAAKLWREQATAKGLDFTLDLRECPTMVSGDVARVRQIVFNLLSNALKFTAEGSIGLSVTTGAGTYRLAVTDTGIGIVAEQRDAIFESFRQADAGTTRQFGGTGLGLTICRNLARAMGGDVDVTSEPGRGSTFAVVLPLRAPASAAAPTAPDDICDTTLIVDANPISRATLAALIGRRDTRAVAVPSVDEVMPRAFGACVVIDQNALISLPDPAADLKALREGATRVVVLWRGEVPRDIAAAATRVVAKPIGGTALLAAVFDTLSQQVDATALVPRAA